MTTRVAAVALISAETLEDAQGFLDRMAQALAADHAAKGERYGGVYRRGFHAGADAAFAALHDYIAKGGRVGLPMGTGSLHIVDAKGGSFEIASLLALRPFGLWTTEDPS